MTARRALLVVVPLALTLVLTLCAWSPARRHVQAAHLLAVLAKAPADAEAEPTLEESDLEVPRGDRRIRSRIYRMAGNARGPGVVVAHGVHYRGIDERRLIPFARALAREGLVVMTPELRELADYQIAEASTADLAASIEHLSGRADIVDSPKVGVIGFSFAGGLALVAASAPGMRDRLSWVVSIGGHHDLRRVLTFFVDDRIAAPWGVENRKAHEYGLVVLLYGHVASFVAEEDRGVASDALRAWLREDREQAEREAARCTTEACSELFAAVRGGQAKQYAPRVRELIAAHPHELTRLSPRGHLTAIGVPVHLLHGAGDSVIPPTESQWAAAELGDHDHSLLVSQLVEHVEMTQPAGWKEKAAIVHFMASIM